MASCAGNVTISPHAAATVATTANANTVFQLIDVVICFPLRGVYQKPFPHATIP
jgi:hypothetical protein